MARKRNLFQLKVSTILKHSFGKYLFGISCISFTLLTQGQTLVFASERHKAQELTRIGHSQMEEGSLEAALKSWEQAKDIYHNLGNKLGVKGSLLNQSLAFEALGENHRACQTLVIILSFEDWVCSTAIQMSKEEYLNQLNNILEKHDFGGIHSKELEIQVIGFRNLGNILRLLGRPEGSQKFLQKSLSLSDNYLNKSFYTRETLLDLMNTKGVLYKQSKNKYQLTSDPIIQQIELSKITSTLKDIIEIYNKIHSSTDKEDSTSLKARLNKSSIFLDVLTWEELNNNSLKNENSFKTFTKNVKTISKTNYQGLSVIELINAETKLAKILIEISQSSKLNRMILSENIKSLSLALDKAENTYEQTEKLNNKNAIRLRSYSLGLIGEVYYYQNQLTQSSKYFLRSIYLAKSIQAYDIAYEYQRKLGLLYKRLGMIEASKKMYSDTINSLDNVRSSIISMNPDFQFNFKEKVEPVYKEYIDLLFSQDSPNFDRIIQINEDFKIAELENFLQCGKLDIRDQDFKETSIKSGNYVHTIFLMNLVNNKVKVILRTPDNNFYYHVVDGDVIDKKVNDLLNIIQSDTFVTLQPESFLNYPQDIYKEIILPIKKYLPPSGDLVFVMDNNFQNIPLGMLHDGKDYLMKSYNLSIALGSQFRRSITLKNKQLNVIFAGMSDINPDLNKNLSITMNPLPEVKEESDLVKSNTSKFKLFLNEKFTSKNIRQLMSKKPDFGVLHISSHGQFSSDVSNTFILAWDKPINVRELQALIRNYKKSIDLIVLSACQTAKGDKRSVLGMAGVSVMSGARSTLGTLWLVDSASTAKLMGHFYSGLKSGLNEAEALRQAQLKLLEDSEYSHPYYWAPFTLLSR